MSSSSSNDERDALIAHNSSRYNRSEITQSTSCGCFFCLKTFPPEAIERWVDRDKEGVGQTARCPHCQTDAVIGAVSGFPLTPKFLTAMKEYWFEKA